MSVVMETTPEEAEPEEATLPDKPPVEDVPEDTTVPGAEEVPEEEFMDPAAAGANEEVDSGETEPQARYTGGTIPHNS